MTASDKAFTGSIPQIYDQLMVPLIFEPYAQDLAQRTTARRPRDVLETAAGTGVVTRALHAGLPPDVRITATDLSEPMLMLAKTHFAEGNRMTWQQADALALPFADASFDAVVCQFGVMFFPDRLKGYAEARRVLRPGGRFIFNVWDRIEHNAFPQVVHETLQQLFPDNPPQFFTRTPHGYYDIGRIKADLTAAGFIDIEIETVTHRSRAASSHEPATAFCQGTPMRGEIEARGTPGLAAVTQAVAEALERQFGRGPIEGRIQALVISAA
ncbi:ubiquinone/menaquinone biosynthesis methyltransferase [Bradyrhizobium sp. SSBR45G]|uniref:class I SAM-dependent methyltransferase n=1 Tax=unclassified Bradyrhizobium TaxID=2631580 RepID=UPI002342BB4B|nr:MULTISPECIES: methyltransferase domain-containing protein [unclassified Bradyrhizobium]GLH80225.1 ubiquinone/menaquinone biosynthesis methyltransferase [Bradyrhizobium sp. SSBR45G]GLH87719.1 ubiquinone/menaquinone biosynthesis methyltransferase [Bradyrhizobium sp. SSBR45R]